jgi:hypothetical protein
MVISTITPPCFPPLGPEGVRVFSHHLPRHHPRRLDDDDELYRIMSQFHGVEDFLTLSGLMRKPCFFVSLAEKCEPDLILPFRLLEKIRNLSKPIIIFNRSNTIYAASVILRTLVDCTFFDRRQTQKPVWRELICRDTMVFYIT